MINMSLAPGQNASLSMGFRMDGVTELLRLPNMSISYYGNPTFQTMQSALELDPGDSTNVTIRVSTSVSLMHVLHRWVCFIGTRLCIHC